MVALPVGLIRHERWPDRIPARRAVRTAFSHGRADLRRARFSAAVKSAAVSAVCCRASAAADAACWAGALTCVSAGVPPTRDAAVHRSRKAGLAGLTLLIAVARNRAVPRFWACRISLLIFFSYGCGQRIASFPLLRKFFAHAAKSLQV